jgi:hypothetical protein
MDALVAGVAVAFAVAAFVGYADLPARAPMYTGFNGRSSRERVPKIAYLVGLFPLTGLALVFTLATLSNVNLNLPKRAQVAETLGDLFVLLVAWWGAAMVWSIGETARGQRGRVPALVMPVGAYAIVAFLIVMLAAIGFVR